MYFMSITVRELAESDSRFSEQLDMQVERILRANIPEHQRLLAISRIIDGIHVSLTSPEYRSSVIVTPSRLPRMVDDDSIGQLARLQTQMRMDGRSDPEIRESLEILEHGLLIKQQHREQKAKRCASESVDSGV
jgi:hypothetical protein